MVDVQATETVHAFFEGNLKIVAWHWTVFTRWVENLFTQVPQWTRNEVTAHSIMYSNEQL